MLLDQPKAGMSNWSAQWITYNSWLVNWGSWYNDVPGWMAFGKPGHMVLEPPLFIPFAHGFGMEIGMTVDAHRAGFRLVEVELDLEHRVTGRTAAGFVHRARQLADFARVYASRR